MSKPLFANTEFRSDDYEHPLTEIMKLFIGNEPLLKIFIELLPEKFIERKYVSDPTVIKQPSIEDSMVMSIDNMIKNSVPPELYEAYHVLAL